MNPFFKYKHLKRYRDIIGVLIKYGFDDFVSKSGVKRVIPFRLRLSYSKGDRSLRELSRYERVRLMLEELGPTFVKLGQVMSNRQDLIPEQLINELSKLHDQVAPVADLDIRSYLETSLQLEIDKHFNYIKTEPMASASVAQVHEAELKSGEKVVLKVLRPGIEKVINNDVEILKDIARMVAKNVPEIAEMQPMQLIKFFERTIHNELNLLQEAANIERFRHHFAKDDTVYVPKVYHDFTNAKILCMEFIHGFKITDRENLKFNEIDLKEVTQRGVKVYFKMVYEYGFFHADPHPGNLLVLPNRKLCFLDFGMMGSILPGDKKLLHDLLLYFLRKDIPKIIYVLEKLAENKTFARRRELEYDIYDLIQEVSSLPLKELRLSSLLNKFRRIVFDYKIYLPTDFFLLIRTFIVMEGIGLQVNPDFNIFKDMKEFVRDLIRKKMRPGNLYKDLEDYLMEIREIVRQAPEDFKVIVDNLKSGDLNIGFEHKGLDGLFKSLHVVSNRIAVAIISAALVIGSSLIVLSGIPPRVFNVPIIGVIGFLFSLFLGVWIIFDILHRKR